MFGSVKRKFVSAIKALGINSGRGQSRPLRPVASPAVSKEQDDPDKASSALLKMYCDLRAQQTNVPPLDIYVQLICQRTGNNRSDGQRMLRKAEESFAIWPVERPLNLRDVVCYLIIVESLALVTEGSGPQADIVEIVHAVIPENL